MAWARAICKCEDCGAEFEIHKECLNRREADRYEEWAAKHYTVCDECKQKRIEKTVADAGCVPLTGSPKQIEWANSIRAKFIDYVNSRINGLKTTAKYDSNNTDKYFEHIKIFQDAFNYVLSTKTESKWWIDHRTYSGYAWESLICNKYGNVNSK